MLPPFMRSSMQHSSRMKLALLCCVACVLGSLSSAQGQFPAFEPMQPLQPFKPLAPLPPLKPFPGFAPFPEMPQMPQMQFPNFPGFGGGAGGAAATATGGPTGAPGTYSASSSSSVFSGPMGSRTSSTPGCTVVQQTSGESQGSNQAGSTSCSLSQKVEVCQSSRPGSQGHTRAVATINGQESTCCVVLLKLPTKTPQLFCAAPSRGMGYSRMPAANTAVELKPTCSSSLPGTTAGSLACTVSFSKLPEGFTYPEGHTAANPMVLYRNMGSSSSSGSGSSSGGSAGVGPAGAAPKPAAPTASPGRSFVPCNNKRFKKFMQAVSRTNAEGGVVLTSKCE